MNRKAKAPAVIAPVTLEDEVAFAKTPNPLMTAQMVYLDRVEMRARRNTRPAMPGNVCAAIRETVAQVERGALVVDSFLVI